MNKRICAWCGGYLTSSHPAAKYHPTCRRLKMAAYFKKWKESKNG